MKYRETEGIKVRRIGIDISAARLQQELFNLGIQKNVDTLSQADKALLRYIAIMKQTGNAQGDMAATLVTSANQMRVLTAQIDIVSRWLGAIFIPILTKALGYVIAFVKAIGNIAKNIAEAFGFEMPEITMPDSNAINSWTAGLDNVSDSAKNAKKNIRNLIGGFDELNILEDDKGAGEGISELGNILGGMQLPEYPMFARLVETEINDKSKILQERLEKILPLVVGIGVGFGTWKIATSLISDIALIAGLLKKGPGLFGVGALAKLGLDPAIVEIIGKTLGIATILVGRFAELTIKSEVFRNGLKRLGELISIVFNAVQDIVGIIGSIFKYVGNQFLSILPEEVVNRVTNFLSSLNADFTDLGLIVGGVIAFLANPPLGLLILGFETITLLIRGLGTASDETWGKIKAGFESVAEGFVTKWENIKEQFVSGFTLIKTEFGNLKDNFKIGINQMISFVETLINGFVDGINAIKKAFNSIKIAVPDGVPIIGGLDFGFNFGMTKNVTLPKLKVNGYADGGTVPKAQLFYARENGMPEMVGSIGNQTAVANNGQIVMGIANGVASANENVVSAVYTMANIIVNAINNKDTNVSLDGLTLTRQLHKYQKAVSNEHGNSLITMVRG